MSEWTKACPWEAKWFVCVWVDDSIYIKVSTVWQSHVTRGSVGHERTFRVKFDRRLEVHPSTGRVPSVRPGHRVVSCKDARLDHVLMKFQKIWELQDNSSYNSARAIPTSTFKKLKGLQVQSYDMSADFFTMSTPTTRPWNLSISLGRAN